MSERTTLEVIAPTVEEALAQGLSQLGLSADAVSIEVVDAGNKGLFGLGGRQVRVRLTVRGSGEIPPVVTESAPASKPDPKPAPVQKANPKPEAAPVPPAAPEAHDPLLDTTQAVVSKLLSMMKLKAQVSARFTEESTDDRRDIYVDVRGEDLTALIGRHAETLNAFQYIASLMVGKETQQWVQLVVDVEGFRSRRERQLKQLANRMAEQVVQTGRRGSLEPMPANERRIIHLELRSHPAVTTESTGEEPHRKVVVVPKE